MSEMKYEIKGGPGNYSVFYGPGYPFSEFLRYTCFTLRSAKRVIRRHKRRVRQGKIAARGDGNRYGIVYTEEMVSRRDVEDRIRELERELGLG